MTGQLDEQERRTAARIGAAHPRWLIIWGTHTRLYWAFSRFTAPAGTGIMLSAAGPRKLLIRMHDAELAARIQPPRPPPPAPLPITSQPLSQGGYAYA
jgi:hypothetical protein